MGVKVVSVERRDTPTRYDLFHVWVGYVQMRAMSPQIEWYFVLFSPAGSVKNVSCYCIPPPPPPSIYFEAYFAGVSWGYRYWLDYDLFSK
jgi:hypothetical protein